MNRAELLERISVDPNVCFGERGRQMLSDAGHAVATIRIWDAATN